MLYFSQLKCECISSTCKTDLLIMVMYRVGQNSMPLCLTVYIFKMYEPICVIFGILWHCFVLNTSVNSILNKFIAPVVPLGDKINNSVFHLQNQVRALHSKAHVFKIPTPICTLFGTVEQHDILNIPITLFSTTA